MLHEFIALHRDGIVVRTRDRVRGRPWPSVSSRELEYGVPLFLTQLSETPRLERTAIRVPSTTSCAVTASRRSLKPGSSDEVAQWPRRAHKERPQPFAPIPGSY